MVELRQFRTFYPNQEYIEQILESPEQFQTIEDQINYVKTNRYSFHRIQNSRLDFDQEMDLESEEDQQQIYRKGCQNIDDFIKQELYLANDQKQLYIYGFTKNDRNQFGIVGESSLNDYYDGKIMKHESTRQKVEEQICRMQNEYKTDLLPVMMAYQQNHKIDQIVEQIVFYTDPVVEFNKSQVKHSLWKIPKNQSEIIQNIFNNEIHKMYICDGHHRIASGLRNQQQYKLQMLLNQQQISGNEDFNFILSMVIPFKQLDIYDYNRVIKDMNGYSEQQIFQFIQKDFMISQINESQNNKCPLFKTQISIYIENKWYLLKLKESSFEMFKQMNHQIADFIDVDILQKLIIEPIFGIVDQRNNDRLDFVNGSLGSQEIERKCQNGFKIGFMMFPLEFESVIRFAEMNQNMPPKSTWIEPKPTEGFLLRKLID